MRYYGRDQAPTGRALTALMWGRLPRWVVVGMGVVALAVAVWVAMASVCSVHHGVGCPFGVERLMLFR